LDIEAGERVDGEIDHMIQRRHEERVQDEGQQRIENLWTESLRRYNARQEADHRAAWHEYEMRLYRIHTGLAAEHLARAEKLENGH
jgi:hypothetical protein